MKVCGPEPILLPLHPLSSLRWRPPQMLPVKKYIQSLLFSCLLGLSSSGEQDFSASHYGLIVLLLRYVLYMYN